MTHATKRDGTALTVTLWGRLDATSCPEIEAAVAQELEGVDDFTVDMAGVAYVSSMGLRLLLSWQKRMFEQGAMHVVNVNEDVMALLEETGFTELMDIR